MNKFTKKEQTGNLNTVNQRKAKVALQDNRNASIQCHSEEPLQRNNTGLPDNLKSGMEKLSGVNLDHVKVHYNSPKPAAVQAHAYAQGSDIHLASGQEKHLPHELGHVVQQAQGRVKPTTNVGGVAVNDNEALESEATRMGNQALQMQSKNSLSENVTKPTSLQTDMAMQLISQTQDAIETNHWDTAQMSWNQAIQKNTDDDWASIQRVAYDYTQSRIGGGNGIAQRVEKSTWEMISDALTLSGILATAVSTIASLAKASGFGWIIPVVMAPLAKFVTSMLSTWGKTDDEETKEQKTISAVTALVGALATGVLGVVAATDDENAETYKIIATLVTLAIMTVLEALRVKFLDRDSIYKVVWDKVKSLRSGGEGENAALLA